MKASNIKMLLAFLLPTDPPPAGNWFYPMFWPWVIAAFGAYLHFKANKMQTYGSKTPYQSLALPLCVIALIWGCLPLYVYMTDFIYRDVISSGKVKLGHFLAPIGPLAALAAVAVNQYTRKIRLVKENFIEQFVR